MNFVYILRCADDTYYTGWTNHLTDRLTAHNHGAAGAKYTRSRRPVRLVYCEMLPDRNAAMKREVLRMGNSLRFMMRMRRKPA